MGSNQSSHAADISTQEDYFHSSSHSSSVRGRKAINNNNTSSCKSNDRKIKEFGSDPTETTDRIDEDFLHSDEEIEVPFAAVLEVDDEEEEESEEEEEYEDELERERVLNDMKQLKKLADMYMHPEKPVQVDGTAFGRCFFNRPSAVELKENVTNILQDALALKTWAKIYMHPQVPVETTDPTACARCYFDRPSAALEQQAEEDMEEREHVLADATALKQLAVDYLHPEIPVVTTDATAFGRNYFTRASAGMMMEDEEEEREQILREAKALKKLAVEYLHPEMSVATTDPTVFGRNYFTRPFAPQVVNNDDDEEDEREQILRDAAALKSLAIDYLHPEMPVTVDPTSFGRNYFTRPSAPEVDDEEEERAQVLADALALKKLAVDYLHPEIPVVTTDPTAFGRNYFTRPSAPEVDDNEEEARSQVMADMTALKKLAGDYLHPEMPVVVDATAFGRNYFTRPSAAQVDEAEEERDQVLADATALKKLAVDYLHPEMPIVTTDPTACGRNYFTRPSAPEQEDEDEREQVLADVAALKKLAVDYAHPEMPVGVDPAAFGRNYFTRPSAPDQVDEDERDQVLADMAALKKLAVDYLHPEVPVVTTDPTIFGRNYFTRPSAPEQEDEDDREQVLADLAIIKKLAVDYAHPEKPVVVDPAAFGRNYFTRPSAPEQEDEDEREQVMADKAALKKLAVDYAHPELPVVSTDPTACGRNYFTRPAAPEQEDVEDEHKQIMADVVALKKLTVDYLHPELPVITTDPTAFGRNYFTRPSAPEVEEERDQVLADLVALKKLAVDYLHPELPVITKDPTAFGRNYFTRPSAPDQESSDEVDDRVASLEDAMSLKKLAMDYAHPELPCETTDPYAKGRNYFNRPSAPGHAEFIHSSGFDNNVAKHDPHGTTEVAHDDYDHYDMEHHEEHHDHFEMDEDIWSNMYSSLNLPGEVSLKGGVGGNDSSNMKSQDEEEEGKLSRSPSSVMLFEQGGMEGY